ncbi:MAG: ATP-dependent Clp protease proteolytic subunit [Planctomycetota bacterium]|nr:ATP-dependent Clp protease proteolytic subunit [Planctomycetota bacterium]
MKPHPAPHRSNFQPASEDAARRNGWEIAISGDLSEKQSDLAETLLDVEVGSSGTIFFDSAGGSAYVGISLASLIKLRGLKATAVVLGECSSAALLPFAACEERYVLPYSSLYFHPVRWSSEEDIQLEEAAEWTRHFAIIEDEMDKILSDLFGKPFAEVRGWTRPGRFFTGRDVVALGLAKLLDLHGGDVRTQVNRLRAAQTAE